MNNSKSKIKIFMVSMMVLWVSLVQADVTVYKTYEDYKADRGEQHPNLEYDSYAHAMGSVTVYFKVKGGEKLKIKCRDYWGFKYNDVLFRMEAKLSQPTRVVSVGKICYYENGIAHLDMMKKKSDVGSFSVGYFCYLSKDLNSELCPMPGEKISDAKSKVRKFKDEHPEYEKLFDCIYKNYSYETIRTCVAEFEGK